MKRLIMLLAAAICSACASAPKPKPALQIRAAKLVDAPKFDMDAAIDAALAHEAARRYQQATTALTNILARMAKDDIRRSDLLVRYAYASMHADKPDLTSIAAMLGAAKPNELSTDGKRLADETAALYAFAHSGDTGTAKKAARALGSEKLWANIAHHYQAKKDWLAAQDASLAALTLAASGSGRVAPHISDLGTALLWQGRSAEAAEKFAQAVSLDSGAQAYRHKLVLARLLVGGEHQPSLTGISDEHRSEIFHQAGTILLQFEKLMTAERYFKKAQSISPRWRPDTQAALSQLTKNKGRPHTRL